MAGSLRWFRYLSDNGTSYGVLLDESNTELLNAPVVTDASPAGLNQPPKGLSPRSVTLESADGLVRRVAVILTQAAFAAISTATDYQLTAANFSGVAVDTVVNPVYTTAERFRRRPKRADTRQLDGDNP